METTNYKVLIKNRLADLKKTKPISLRKLAHHIDIQYTYLSKVLNSDEQHLNDDQLFKIGKYLNFSTNEIEYLLTLKAYSTTSDPDRRDLLSNKLDQFQGQAITEAEVVSEFKLKVTDEMTYLLDPLCVVVHVSLYIPSFKKDPRLLMRQLSIDEGQLKRYLQVIEDNGYIKRSSDDPFKIKEILEANLHFGKEHPLMRTHQRLLKNTGLARLTSTKEEDKHSFLVNFTMAPQDYPLIKKEFDHFLKRVEKIVSNSAHKSLYQLSFDLFKWF